MTEHPSFLGHSDLRTGKFNIAAERLAGLPEGTCLVPEITKGKWFRGMSLVRAVLNLQQHGYISDKKTHWSSRLWVAKSYAQSVATGATGAIQDTDWDLSELVAAGVKTQFRFPPGLVVAVEDDHSLGLPAAFEDNVAAAQRPILLDDLTPSSRDLVLQFVIPESGQPNTPQ